MRKYQTTKPDGRKRISAATSAKKSQAGKRNKARILEGGTPNTDQQVAEAIERGVAYAQAHGWQAGVNLFCDTRLRLTGKAWRLG